MQSKNAAKRQASQAARSLTQPVNNSDFINQTPFRAAERHFKRKLCNFDICFDPTKYLSSQSTTHQTTLDPAEQFPYLNTTPSPKIIELEFNLHHQFRVNFGDTTLTEPTNTTNKKTPALVFPSGLIFIPNQFTPTAQSRIIKECLRDYTKLPNFTNLDTHYLCHESHHGIWDRHLKLLSGELTLNDKDSYIPLRNQSDGDDVDVDITIKHQPPQELDINQTKKLLKDANSAIKSTPFSPRTTELLVSDAVKKLRWTSLGFYYNWSKKEYYDVTEALVSGVKPRPKSFPETVEKICRAVVECVEPVTGFRESRYIPEAGIVNFYQYGDSLMAHQDRSEVNFEAPLVSFSFGNSCVFLMGTETRDDAPIPIILRSGDCLIMSGACRRGFHGVPRIIENTFPEYLEDYGEDWEPYKEFLRVARINVNVRQIW
ncbi:hypothetical protein HK098_001008 [Nowakowskiella sp. JEL0407]|nr:hypothetical protein HK098_001008 [Nowakowskiella sp. JEL0407]